MKTWIGKRIVIYGSAAAGLVSILTLAGMGYSYLPDVVTAEEARVEHSHITKSVQEVAGLVLRNAVDIKRDQIFDVQQQIWITEDRIENLRNEGRSTFDVREKLHILEKALEDLERELLDLER